MTARLQIPKRKQGSILVHVKSFTYVLTNPPINSVKWWVSSAIIIVPKMK